MSVSVRARERDRRRASSSPHRGRAERRSLAFETVFSAPDKVDFVHRGIAAGFFVRLFFVGTDGPEINAARVARRMLQGGHEVPIRKIIDRWSRSISNCVLVANVVDRLYVYDNSVNERPAQLVVRASAGTVARRYAPARPWMAPILAQVMEPQTKGKAVFPPFFQKLIDDAELKGRVEGLAKMLLIVLRARGMAVTDAARERILAEKDPEQLLRWIERAAVAGSIADVLDDPS